MLEYLRLSWKDIEKACDSVAEEIKTRGIAHYVLVGISRGGLAPARLLSDRLSGQEISTMSISFYEDINRTKKTPEVIHPVQAEIKGKDVLLVDDISDTGGSLKAAMKHLKEKGAKKIVVATLVKKPHTHLVPDVFAIETSAWVIFPWELYETMRLIVEKALDRRGAEKELKKAGIEKEEYEKVLNAKFKGE
jgi:hypoxanthine phosphoribosyltransferase